MTIDFTTEPPPAGAVRQRGERRTRRRVAATAAVVVATVVGVSAGAYALNRNETARPAVPASPSAEPTLSPSPSAESTRSPRPVPTVIPGSALLQPADMGEAGAFFPLDLAEARQVLTPKPCNENPYPSDRYRVAGAAGSGMMIDPSTRSPAAIWEVVTSYLQDRAADYLAELRRELDRCAVPLGQPGWSSQGSAGLGDDSLLLRRTWPEETFSGSGRKYTEIMYLVVVRLGNVVLSLSDGGWEQYGGVTVPTRERALFMVGKAVARARTIA